MNLGTNYQRYLLSFATFLLSITFAAVASAAGSFSVVPADGHLQFNTHAGVTGAKTIHVTNQTSAPLALSLAVSGSPKFTLVGLPAVTLSGNGSQDVTIDYNSLLEGRDYGTLKLTAANGDTMSIALNGHTIESGDDRVVTTNELDFNTTVGQTECLPVSLGNQTIGDITVTSIRVTGDSSEFTATNSGSANLSSGDLGSINVCFHPVTANGHARGELNIGYTSSLDSTVRGTATVDLEGVARASGNIGDSLFFTVTNGLNFNNVAVGQQSCQAIQISNPTGAAVVIDSASVAGNGAAAYTVSGASMLQVGAHSVQYVNVCFLPTKAGGDQNGTVVFTYNVPGTTLQGHLYTSLEGSAFTVDSNGIGGESSRCLIVRHGGPDLGTILVGGSSAGSVYLTNHTNAPLTITGGQVTSDNSGSFSVAASQFPMTLQSGEQGQLNVNFAPSANTGITVPTKYTANVTLNVSGTGVDCGPVTINVSGVALPSVGDTGTLTLGGGLNNGGGNTVIGITGKGNAPCTIDTLTFYNTTNSSVNVEAVQLGSSANFTLLGTSMTLPGSVAAGGQLQAYVQFCSNGQTNTVMNGQLYLLTDQSIQPQTYYLQGIQRAAAGVAIAEMAPVSFSIMPNPASGRVTIEVGNARSTKLEIYDVLGSLVTSISGTSKLTWEGRDASGSMLPNGEYIARVSGTDNLGGQFKASRQIVIQH